MRLECWISTLVRMERKIGSFWSPDERCDCASSTNKDIQFRKQMLRWSQGTFMNAPTTRKCHKRNSGGKQIRKAACSGVMRLWRSYILTSWQRGTFGFRLSRWLQTAQNILFRWKRDLEFMEQCAMSKKLCRFRDSGSSRVILRQRSILVN